MIGQIESCLRDYDGNYHITFKTKDNAGAVYDEFNGQDVEITICKPRKKRSLSANSYLWELCGQIADKLSDEGTITTKEDIYRMAIKEVGVYRDIPMLSQGVDTLCKAWEMHGIGWFTETVDYLPGNAGYLIRCYYGSSCYNSKQFSRVLNSVIQDAEALDIDTRTPDEINNMLSLWEQERKKNVR